MPGRGVGASAYAPSGWKMRSYSYAGAKERKSAMLPLHWKTALATALWVATFAIVNIAQAQAGSSAAGQHMEGAWQVTIKGEGRPVELAFNHFTADGTML